MLATLTFALMLALTAVMAAASASFAFAAYRLRDGLTCALFLLVLGISCALALDLYATWPR